MEKEQNWEVLIKQFMKRDPRMSVNEFCRKEKPAGVGEIVEVMPYRKKSAPLLLDINGVRIKGTPDTDKQFLKEFIVMLLYW